jgi:hypothetical protein
MELYTSPHLACRDRIQRKGVPIRMATPYSGAEAVHKNILGVSDDACEIADEDAVFVMVAQINDRRDAGSAEPAVVEYDSRRSQRRNAVVARFYSV